jgi:hypothetical protein
LQIWKGGRNLDKLILANSADIRPDIDGTLGNI